MAEVLSEFQSVPGKRGRNGHYLKFLDGQVWKVVNGVDFNAKNMNSATNAFYVAAGRNGKRIRIQQLSTDPITLIVQAYPKAQ